MLFFCRKSKYPAPLRLPLSLSFRFGRLLFSLSLPFGRWRGLPFTFFLFRQLCSLLFLFNQVFLDSFWKLLLRLRVFLLEGDQKATAGGLVCPAEG